jgi:uncharacterized membrane protein HdeD (DUF308 family)
MSPTLDRGSGVFAGPARAASKGSTFAFGVILFVLGILALIFADVVTVASVISFGALLVVGGGVELVHALRQHGGGDRFFLPLLSGLLSVAVGAVMILRPGVGVAGSGLLIAGWLLATGLFRGVVALLDRYRYWGWDLFYGALSILLGFWLTTNLPTSAMWLLGTVVAVELMARGVAVMGASMALQRLERSSVPAR